MSVKRAARRVAWGACLALLGVGAGGIALAIQRAGTTSADRGAGLLAVVPFGLTALCAGVAALRCEPAAPARERVPRRWQEGVHPPANGSNKRSRQVTARAAAEFECWCARQLMLAGWEVERVGRCGDQGVDLRAHVGTIRMVVQCKAGRRRATNAAVQQVYAGAAYHGSTLATVISAGGFTPSAVALATRIGVILLVSTDLVDPAAIRGRLRVLSGCVDVPLVLSRHTGPGSS